MERKQWSVLKSMRDEIKLQAHLMSMESKDSFNSIDARFEKLRRKLDEALKISSETFSTAWESEKKVVDELKTGLQKILK